MGLNSSPKVAAAVPGSNSNAAEEPSVELVAIEDRCAVVPHTHLAFCVLAAAVGSLTAAVVVTRLDRFVLVCMVPVGIHSACRRRSTCFPKAYCTPLHLPASVEASRSTCLRTAKTLSVYDPKTYSGGQTRTKSWYENVQPEGLHQRCWRKLLRAGGLKRGRPGGEHHCYCP